MKRLLISFLAAMFRPALTFCIQLRPIFHQIKNLGASKVTSSRPELRTHIKLLAYSSLTRAAVSYDATPVNGYGVLRLSWPSKSFIESDTTQSAAEARQDMFPDGGIYANIPSIGNCLTSLLPEELEQLPSVTHEAASSPALLPAYRCEQVLTQLLLSLERSHRGFRGLPIDILFNEDKGNDDPESPLVFTGWPNIRRLQLLAQHGEQEEALEAEFNVELQPPYVPNNCDDFNIPPENADSRNYHDELAALEVCAPLKRTGHNSTSLTSCSTRPMQHRQDLPLTSRSDLFAATFRLFSTWNACGRARCTCCRAIVSYCSS
jgi:hypothetical protein